MAKMFSGEDPKEWSSSGSVLPSFYSSSVISSSFGLMSAFNAS